MTDRERMPNSAAVERRPSPWWPCPQCGHAEFTTTVMFERGGWEDPPSGNDDDLSTYREFEPPDGKPTAVGLNVTCTNCRHQFNIFEHYGWGGDG